MRGSGQLSRFDGHMPVSLRRIPLGAQDIERYTQYTKYGAGAGPGGVAPPPLGILYIWYIFVYLVDVFGYFFKYFWYIFGQLDTRENHPDWREFGNHVMFFDQRLFVLSAALGERHRAALIWVVPNKQKQNNSNI